MSFKFFSFLDLYTYSYSRPVENRLLFCVRIRLFYFRAHIHFLNNLGIFFVNVLLYLYQFKMY